MLQALHTGAITVLPNYEIFFQAGEHTSINSQSKRTGREWAGNHTAGTSRDKF